MTDGQYNIMADCMRHLVKQVIKWNPNWYDFEQALQAAMKYYDIPCEETKQWVKNIRDEEVDD